VTLTVAENGELYLEGYDLTPTDKHLVEEKLKTFITQDPEGTVLLMADQGVRHQEIVKALDLIREAGVRRVAYATKLSEPKK